MANKFNVIIDTNVIVSSLITPNSDAATAQVLNLFYNDNVTLYYSNEIFKEYIDVLNRDKFCFDKDLIKTILDFIKQNGVLVNPKKLDTILIDIKDKPFYEIVMDNNVEDSKLITGNLKHYPINPKIMTPNDFLKIYNKLS